MGCLGLRQLASELLKEFKTAYLLDGASNNIGTQLNVGRAT